jgi:hypothetical protein
VVLGLIQNTSRNLLSEMIMHLEGIAQKLSLDSTHFFWKYLLNIVPFESSGIKLFYLWNYAFWLLLQYCQTCISGADKKRQILISGTFENPRIQKYLCLKILTNALWNSLQQLRSTAIFYDDSIPRSPVLYTVGLYSFSFFSLEFEW